MSKCVHADDFATPSIDFLYTFEDAAQACSTPSFCKSEDVIQEFILLVTAANQIERV